MRRMNPLKGNNLIDRHGEGVMGDQAIYPKNTV